MPVCEPLADADCGAVDLLDPISGSFVSLFVAVGVSGGADALVDVLLCGVALDLAASNGVRAPRNDALQQHEYEVVVLLHFPGFTYWSFAMFLLEPSNDV